MKIPRWVHVPWFAVALCGFMIWMLRGGDGLLDGEWMALSNVAISAWMISSMRGWIR